MLADPFYCQNLGRNKGAKRAVTLVSQWKVRNELAVAEATIPYPQFQQMVSKLSLLYIQKVHVHSIKGVLSM